MLTPIATMHGTRTFDDVLNDLLGEKRELSESVLAPASVSDAEITARFQALASPVPDATVPHVEPRAEAPRQEAGTIRPMEPAEEPWLLELPDGVRAVFRHLWERGTITEEEAQRMLGDGRAFRRFSRELERHAALAPFRVRVEFVSGVKRYVRDRR